MSTTTTYTTSTVGTPITGPAVTFYSVITVGMLGALAVHSCYGTIVGLLRSLGILRTGALVGAVTIPNWLFA